MPLGMFSGRLAAHHNEQMTAVVAPSQSADAVRHGVGGAQATDLGDIGLGDVVTPVLGREHDGGGIRPVVGGRVGDGGG